MTIFFKNNINIIDYYINKIILLVINNLNEQNNISIEI